MHSAILKSVVSHVWCRLSREMRRRLSERGTAAFLTLSVISEDPTRSGTFKKAGITDLTYVYVCTHIIWSHIVG
jgi:hypothetical protein